MSHDKIIIKNANVHNLKNLSISIPKNKLVVVTGPSGSGKSSLAFDTIHLEGQRRYIESLFSHAKNFLGLLRPPSVDSIIGLTPTVAIDQKTVNKNPRSTVGTITEIYDYLRILFARVGTVYCPKTGVEIIKSSSAKIASHIIKLPNKSKIEICIPFNLDDAQSLHKLKTLSERGFTRILQGSDTFHFDNDYKRLDKNQFAHLVIDRVILTSDKLKRIQDSIELARQSSPGAISLLVNQNELPELFFTTYLSPHDLSTLPEISPKIFSFNSPHGACPSCGGLGFSRQVSDDLVVLNPEMTVESIILRITQKKNSFLYQMVEYLVKKENFDLKTCWRDLSRSQKALLLNGSTKSYNFNFTSENNLYRFQATFIGIKNWLREKYAETSSERLKSELETFFEFILCPQCRGQRLNSFSLRILLEDKNISELSMLSLENLLLFFKNLKLNNDKLQIASKLIKEISLRLNFLNDVGLGYLSLNRSANTLSGGEHQRIRLATQIGSGLTGVTYVLDEPSIGLHSRDNLKLIDSLSTLRDLGNTVIIVEHDEETIKKSDYVIDIGPGAGNHGGEVIYHGTFSNMIREVPSSTSRYFTDKSYIPVPLQRRKISNFLFLQGASDNNLKNLNVKIPLSGLVCITGVSGSGKSTLIHKILSPAIKHFISPNRYRAPLTLKKIEGADTIKSLIELDQAPIGRSPNSNPATYTGLFDHIRKLYSQTSESQIRGYSPGRFSFNLKGGRCEECEGNGVKKIEMNFMPDIYIDCNACFGKKYNTETLQVLYRGKNIDDVLNLTIEDACLFFKNHRKIHQILSTLYEVGLGYLKLGQSALTLSGGEAQRLKLATELAKSTKGKTIYILDEPTTGLHFSDIKILLSALNKLVDKGHTVIVIEHNMDIIKTCDWVIDLGPEGGERGGQLVAEGTPEDVSIQKSSYTGRFLKNYL